MKPYPWPAAVPPEDLGDPTVLVAHGSQPGPIHIEIAHASPEHRRHLGPFIRFLRLLPKPPVPERISIAVAEPQLLSLLLEGRLSIGSLETVKQVVGLHVCPPDDRWGASAPVLNWIAMFWERLRARLQPNKKLPALTRP